VTFHVVPFEMMMVWNIIYQRKKKKGTTGEEEAVGTSEE